MIESSKGFTTAPMQEAFSRQLVIGFLDGNHSGGYCPIVRGKSIHHGDTEATEF